MIKLSEFFYQDLIIALNRQMAKVLEEGEIRKIQGSTATTVLKKGIMAMWVFGEWVAHRCYIFHFT